MGIVYFEWKFRDGYVGVARLTNDFGIVEDTARIFGNAEISGDAPEFAAENFASTRERAEFAAPYPSKNESAREHVLDVVELAICSHRQTAHEEDHAERIEFLKGQDLDTAEIEMATREWWNE